MSTFYGATGLIGGSAGDLDNIDGTNLAAGDGAVVITSTAAYLYYLNASSGAAESIPDIISPDANAGNKRWILIDIIGEDAIVELLKLYDTDKSHDLSIKWNENDTASRILNLLVGGGDRSLTLNENLTIGDGEAGTITFSAAGKTVTIAGSCTLNDWFDQAVKAASSPTWAGATISGLTASRALQTNASKALESSAVTSTELGYVSGVTSGIQAQINAKASTDHDATHITSGSDEIDGDKLDIDFTPTNYSPDITPAEADHVDNLAAHLAGIDNALGNWYGLAWNESTDAYTRRGSLLGVACGTKPDDSLIPVQAAMRRCVVSDAGVVQYYLDPTDSTKKADGSASDLTGGDGQVMVEIPKFYIRYAYSANVHTWDISLSPLSGFVAHPAFFKDGAWVDHRYVGAYEASLWDDDTSAMYSDADAITNGVYDAGDKLCSVTAQCPKTNETRANFRAAASARGTGWREMDYFLLSTVQLLYLVEYGDFDSQTCIGMGRTQLSGGTWEVGSYIGRTGLSNGDGDATNAVAYSGDADDAGADAAYMVYRGIENLYGNVWVWIDGININDNIPYVSNNEALPYADDTATGYDRLVDIGGNNVTLHNANGYVGLLEQIQTGFLPADVSGSDATKLCDNYYQDAGWRVVPFGGHANNSLDAGAFYVYAAHSSSYCAAAIGGRLCF